MFKRKFVFMEGEPSAAGGGDAGATPAGGAPAGDAGAAGGDAGGAAATVLAGAAPAASAAPAAGATPGPNDWIPEKFRVMKEDGAMDLEASARKVEEHRSHLEKRMGAGDLPPKTAAEYKLNVPDAFKELFPPEKIAEDPALKSFLDKAHAEGMTQKNVDLFLNEWFERSTALLDTKATMDAENCTNALKEVWKTDTEFKENNQAAYRAAKEYGGDQFDAILSDYGNAPRIIQLLAKVGKELGEDRSASVDARGKSDLQNMQDEHTALGGWLNNAVNRSNPEFEAKNRRYSLLSEQIWGSQPRRSGSISINTV